MDIPKGLRKRKQRIETGKGDVVHRVNVVHLEEGLH